MTQTSSLQDLLIQLGQGPFATGLENLSESEAHTLLKELEHLDVETYWKQKKLPLDQTNSELSPLKKAISFSDIENPEVGKTLIKQGKVGCLIVAGGEGSRLGFNGPKGTFPITAEGKSLFQIFAEKTVAASQWAKRPLPLAIMTSPSNHDETVRFFEEHNFFGLQKQQLSFFCQGTLPYLDKEGSFIRETQTSLAQGPDGNGSVFKHFYLQGIWSRWKELGVEYINFILVDNPLAEPFDPHLATFHQESAADVVVKCVEREDPSEKVGLLVNLKNQIQVIEYTELPEEERYYKDKEGNLKHRYANISLFSFTLDFARECALHSDKMPLHRSFKATKFLNGEGKTTLSEAPIAWKYEYFIFDTLSLAHEVKLLSYPRDLSFAPLKNKEGEYSPEWVKKKLEKNASKNWTLA